MAIVNRIGEASVVISVDMAKSIEIGVCDQCSKDLVSIVVRMVELDTDSPDITVACCFKCWPEYFVYLYKTFLEPGLDHYFVCIGEI